MKLSTQPHYWHSYHCHIVDAYDIHFHRFHLGKLPKNLDLKIQKWLKICKKAFELVKFLWKRETLERNWDLRNMLLPQALKELRWECTFSIMTFGLKIFQFIMVWLMNVSVQQTFGCVDWISFPWLNQKGKMLNKIWSSSFQLVIFICCASHLLVNFFCSTSWACH